MVSARIAGGSFKLSNDPAFAEKLTEIVGLYVDPPAHAVVLSIDEKSQIQALDRTQPGLPMKKGRAGTMTHDYKRHGTTTLFAALNVLDGTVIGQNMQRHRHQEFIRFLNRIEREVPADKAIHVILDNYAAHKKDKVQEWLARHPRWTFHFTPTSCSWLNAVEGFFAKLTRRRLKHGVFHSVVDLQAAINRFIREYNADSPKPFVWKANPDDIIAARNRGFQTLESIHSHEASVCHALWPKPRERCVLIITKSKLSAALRRILAQKRAFRTTAGAQPCQEGRNARNCVLVALHLGNVGLEQCRARKID